MTGIMMFGKTPVGVWSSDLVPNNTIKIARTTKVYGLRRAMRTIWFTRCIALEWV
jgi:hypothetical protein